MNIYSFPSTRKHNSVSNWIPSNHKVQKTSSLEQQSNEEMRLKKRFDPSKSFIVTLSEYEFVGGIWYTRISGCNFFPRIANKSLYIFPRSTTMWSNVNMQFDYPRLHKLLSLRMLDTKYGMNERFYVFPACSSDCIKLISTCHKDLSLFNYHLNRKGLFFFRVNMCYIASLYMLQYSVSPFSWKRIWKNYTPKKITHFILTLAKCFLWTCVLSEHKI